ncbi:MAG TPA: hypothetical protein VLA12_20670, partial [Planctomycetaceae bacterium]|nr:hypothetical protein [Planctomycetaceae bacterium]
MPLRKLELIGGTLRLPVLLSSLIVLISDTSDCFAQIPDTETQTSGNSTRRPPQRELISKNFVVHTDLPEAEAQEVLDRLESTLGRISSYWGRRPKQKVVCYIAADLENWRDADFPHGFARALIGGVGGGAYCESSPDERSNLKVTVYASSRLGLVEHESVHAYCGQTFGATGPDWYKEGMAEMAFHGRAGKMEVECDAEVIKYLRSSPRKSVQQITNSGNMHEDLSLSLVKLLTAPGSDTRQLNHERLLDWKRDHGDSVESARKSYHSCWALCHFLSHNPNYAKRFHQLGRSYLSTQSKDQQPHLFPNLLGSMQPEIDFEYRFFLDRLDVGYRVDLCHWDWKGEFRTLGTGQSKSSRIKAAAGYQPSGWLVRKGRDYSYESSG